MSDAQGNQSVDALLAQAAPLQFDVQAEYPVSKEDLFAAIVDFPSMPSWMPMIAKCSVDNSQAQVDGQVGAVRVITPPFMPFPTTFETVRAFEENRLLAYSASDRSLMGMYRNHLGVLTVESTANGSRLRWQTYADPGRFFLMAWIGKMVFGYVIRTAVKNLSRVLKSAD